MATKFDYKTVTPTDMVNYALENLSAEQKTAFKEAALIQKKGSKKGVVDKAKARKFLFENVKGIEWENAPSKTTKSLADIVSEW